MLTKQTLKKTHGIRVNKLMYDKLNAYSMKHKTTVTEIIMTGILLFLLEKKDSVTENGLFKYNDLKKDKFYSISLRIPVNYDKMLNQKADKFFVKVPNLLRYIINKYSFKKTNLFIN